MLNIKFPKVTARDPLTGANLRTFLDLSTSHLTKADNDLLKELAHTETDRPELPIHVYDRDENGYTIIIASSYGGGSSHLTFLDQHRMTVFGLSSALVDLVVYAASRGYTGLWFDCDADRCDCFPDFDWGSDDDDVDDMEDQVMTEIPTTEPETK